VNRNSLLSALCLLGGAVLIAIGWWDFRNPDVINHWWAGEQIYPFYWFRLARTLVVVLPLALLAWWLGVRARALSEDTPLPQRRRRSACGFAVALALPFILVLKYQVTWLGINYGSSVWIYAFILVLSVIVTWLVWPLLKHQQLAAWLDRQGPMVILTAIVIFIVVYGGLSITRYASFRTQALDLGTLHQAIWNTSRGRLLEYTPTPATFEDEAPDLSPRSRLADGRLELILIPLSALYWLWANPSWLIALQAILLAGGAIPLYHLARTRLEDGTATLAITLAYLLYLPLHHVTLAGFHPSALMIPFLLWAWLAAEQRHWRNYYPAVAIALLCGIDAALASLGIGLYLFLKGKGYRTHGAATIILGLAWLALDFGLVVPWVGRFYELEEDALGAVGRLFDQPQNTLRALLDREKLQTLVDLLAALGWTPLLGPTALLPALPLLVYDLLAVPQHQGIILAHDVAPVIPFLFIAAVLGAVNAGRWVTRTARREKGVDPPTLEGRRLVTLFALTTTLLVGLFFSPFPPGWGFRLADHYQISEHERALARTLELIPAEAIVSAPSPLFPHLSGRPVIYLFPTVADAEYVMLDLDYSADKDAGRTSTSVERRLDERLFSLTVDGLLSDPNFHVVAFDNGALILQRGPGEAPAGFAKTLADYRTGLYRSAIVEYKGPTQLKAGNMYQARIVLENRGTQSWETTGPYPINLNYHWWTANGTPVEWYGLPTPLNRVVNPGDVHSQQVRFVTPTQPGDYVLEWDLVHEGRTWFGDQGGITLRVEVTVE
jgi:uncharacterized membrane protein